jgi:uncharacterized membrane protein
MEEWIRDFAAVVAAIIEVAMIAIIATGTAHTFWRVAERVIRRQTLAVAVREIWLHYAAWIVLGLESRSPRT